MAVSLVSTGVQFPDSSIQTTAASASSMTLISTTTSTSGSTVTFTGMTSAYRSYMISVTNLRISYTPVGTGGVRGINMRLSNTNGSSYATTGYLYCDGTTFNISGSGSAQADTNFASNNLTGSNVNAEIIIYNPGVAVSGTWMIYGVTTYSAPPGYGNSETRKILTAGAMVTAGGAGYSSINAVQFYPDGAYTFTSGTWKLYGVA